MGNTVVRTGRRWVVLSVIALGCNSSPEHDPSTAPAAAAHTASSAAASAAASSPAPPSVAESAAPQPAASGTPTEELSGVWEGSYDAKKATIALPPTMKDKGLASDDGKAAIGRGSIELTVLANGDVHGKATGALGAAGIDGKVDGRMIRAVVRPDDPLAPKAMTGVFVGERKGEVIACELHVAGPDGTTIRESTVELKRRK